MTGAMDVVSEDIMLMIVGREVVDPVGGEAGL